MTMLQPRPTQASRRLRLAKFSLVGAAGIGVQLAALALLTRAGLPYLLATALAVESAVLHNFYWHQRFTWAGRGSGYLAETLQRLWRFHVANGAISLVGNLLLMRLLVGRLKLPVIAANLSAICACYLANFLVSDEWVFLASGLTPGSAGGLRPFAHQQQRTLREGHIKKSGGGGQRQTDANLPRQQERSERPQPVQHQQREKQPAELITQAAQIEPYAGKQVQPHRNPNNGRDYQDRGDPSRPCQPLFEQVFDAGQPRQRRDVKAEVHHLYQ